MDRTAAEQREEAEGGSGVRGAASLSCDPSPMSFSVRAATSLDSATLLSLVRALALYERAPDEVVATESDYVRALSASPPEMEALIAEDDERRALGFALFFPTWSTWRGRPGIHLEDLFVVPEARGRGIGRALLARVAALAVERGCARLEWQVLDWNEPALGFYRSLGARSMAEWIAMRADGDALLTLARLS
jgi:GNAT superfamily N-acetyltransferase